MINRLAAIALLATLTTAGTSTAAFAAEENASPSDLEAQLEAAQERLERAAREVAELSAKIGGRALGRYLATHDGPSRAIIGVQLDARGGNEGARVLEVSPGGPAAEAGVVPGDVIVAVNGTEVKGDDATRQVMRLMRDVEPDSKVKLRVLRNGKSRDIEVTARAAPPIYAWKFDGLPGHLSPIVVPRVDLHFDDDDEPFVVFQHGLPDELADMELATLTSQLGRYFGTEKGVLVLRAPRSKHFELEDGDVILAIDGREPQSGSHATRILRSYQPGEKVTLKIMRQRKEMSLETTIPEPSSRPRARHLRGKSWELRTLPGEGT